MSKDLIPTFEDFINEAKLERFYLTKNDIKDVNGFSSGKGEVKLNCPAGTVLAGRSGIAWYSLKEWGDNTFIQADSMKSIINSLVPLKWDNNNILFGSAYGTCYDLLEQANKIFPRLKLYIYNINKRSGKAVVSNIPLDKEKLDKIITNKSDGFIDEADFSILMNKLCEFLKSNGCDVMETPSDGKYPWYWIKKGSFSNDERAIIDANLP